MPDRVARDVLLDTGPIVATLDAGDQWHAQCIDLWDTVLDRCLTTEAVVTEACHLVSRGRANAALPLEFLLAAGIPIVGLESAQQHYAARLMHRYAQLPMDYADAGLVALAHALNVTTVFTTDRRGFRTYQRARGGRFELLPRG